MSAAVEHLQAKLADLKILLDSSTSGEVSKSDWHNGKEVAEDVKQICEKVLPQSNTFAYFVSCFLSPSDENCLYVLLKKLIKRPKFEDAVSILTDAITAVLLKCDLDLSVYVPNLINICLCIMKQDSLKSKRDSGYTLLNTVLEIAVTKNYDLDSKIDEIILFLHKQIENNGIKQMENSGVKNGTYQLMGFLCKNFPEKLMKQKRNYGHLFAKVLGLELIAQIGSKSKKPVYEVLEGCFYGFNGVLCNFSDAFEVNSRITLKQLYDYAKVVCDPGHAQDISRHGPKKAALTLLSTHSHLFKSFFMEDYKVLYSYFKHWTMHSDKEMRISGLKAIETLLQEISSFIVEKIDTQTNEITGVYNYFVEIFKYTLSKSSNIRDVATAAKGYGYFAEATKRLRSESGLTDMLNKFTDRSSLIFIESFEPIEQKVSYVPYFLEAIGNVLSFLNEIPADTLPNVENLHIMLFQHFPYLDNKYYFNAHLVSLKIFAVSLKHDTSYISKIVHQSLIRLFSLPIYAAIRAMELELGGENFKDARTLTYKDYMPVWKTLIGGQGAFKIFEQEKYNDVFDTIFDVLMCDYMDLLNKLDFESEKFLLEDEENQTIDEAQLASNFNENMKKRNDFCIFVNMTDFFSELLPSLKPKRFTKWAATFLTYLVDFSCRYSSISGFYKLLATSLTIAKDLGYFDDISANGRGSEKSDFLQTLSDFAEEILKKMKHFKDDLLVSCLKLILALPTFIASSLTNFLAEALKSALKLGLNYLPLAEACLDALEYWNETLSFNEFKILCEHVLPELDKFLNSEQLEVSFLQDLNLELETTTTSQKSRKRKTFDKRKLLKKKYDNKEIAESKFYAIRSRILLFVGRLGGEINNCLIDHRPEEIAQFCTRWDTVDLLNFNVPFVDIKPTINLDKFLPRLCLLATTCGDRKIKIAACEALHSVVLFMLGKNAHLNFSTEHSDPFYRLFRRVFPVLLQLCCDADEIPRELFRLLLNQIIHWFSSNTSCGNPEVSVLLDTLMNGAQNETDALQREYSAQCINEYLRWSIKHGSQTEKLGAEILLKRLFGMALHPAARKRYAASLIFNSIYRIFREQNDLVNRYTLELFVNYLNSLALSHLDDECEGTIAACDEVISHLERILTKRKELFLKRDPSRRIPHGWQDATVEEFVKWLFDQFGTTAMKFRQRCFELFEKFSPLVITCQGPRQYFSKICNQNGIIYIIKRYEGGYNETTQKGIYFLPVLVEGENLTYSTSCPIMLNWMDYLLSSLDCYYASINDNLINGDDFFISQNLEQMQIFNSISYFANRLLTRNSLSDIAGLDTVITKKDQENFKRLKCTIFVRLMQFFSAILNKCRRDTILNIKHVLWNENFLNITFSCLFDPTSFGFDLKNREISKNLPKIFSHWFSTLSGKRVLFQELNVKISEILENLLENVYPFVPFHTLTRSAETTTTDWSAKSNILKAYALLNCCGLLPRETYYIDGTELWREFVASCTATAKTRAADSAECLIAVCRNWDPSVNQFLRIYLEFVADLDFKMADIVLSLYDSTPVKLSADVISSNFITKGALILDQFADQICILIVKDAKSFVENLLNLAPDVNTYSYQTGDVLCKLLDTIGKDTLLRRNFGETFVEICVDNCVDLLFKWSHCISHNYLKLKTLWIIVVQKLAIINSKAFHINTENSDKIFDQFITLLMDRQTDLKFKVKLLSILAVFSIPNSERDDRLKNGLNELVVRNFPLKSTEYAKGTQECDEYVTAIRRILFAFTITDNTVILEILINLICRESDHMAEQEMTSSLKSYCSSLTLSKCGPIISAPFNIFKNDQSKAYNDQHRLNILEKFLLPMLQHVNEDYLKIFFLRELPFLYSIVDKNFEKLSNSNLRKTLLISKIGAWNLFGIMYANLSADILKGEINSAFINITGRQSTDKAELIKYLIKLLPEARKENILYDIDPIFTWRYRCAAHNCLVAILMATQTKPNLFENYIFKDAWECITEPGKTYYFNIDFQTLPNRRKQILTLKQNYKDARQKNFADGGSNALTQQISATVTTGSPHSLQFLSSQFLAETSLRTDLAQFDFTNSALTHTADSADVSKNRETGKHPEVQIQKTENSEQAEHLIENDSLAVDMEMDDLNRHPCMQLMLTVIKFMVEKKISPINEESDADMPNFMKLMLKQLESGEINTKLFVARVIILLENIFCPYAKHMFAPLIRLFLDNKCGPAGLHDFRVDLLLTVLGWAPKFVPENSDSSRKLCSELLYYFMSNASSANTAVVRRNLQILNILLEMWKNLFVVDLKIVLNYLTSLASESKDTNALLGMQILAVLLRNRVNPLGDIKDDEVESKLYGGVCKFLDNPSIRVYKIAAEVIGLALRFLGTQKDVNDFESHVEKLLFKIKSRDSQGQMKFLHCLSIIQRNYPAFSKKFAQEVLILLPNTFGEFKICCLEIICGCAERIPELFAELKVKGLINLLSIRDELSQLWTLKIIRRIIDKITADDFRQIYPLLITFTDSPNLESRITVVECFFKIYDMHINTEFMDKESNVVDMAVEGLLKFMADLDLGLRQSIYNFWSHETRLSSVTVKRLTNIFKLIYHSNVEQQFLAHANYLLLELTSKSPDFNRELFEKPLRECKFADFRLSTNWRHRYASLQTPSYSDYGSSQGSSILGGGGTLIPAGMLKATVPAHDNQFTLTQSSRDQLNGTYDWMTGEFYNTSTYADIDSTLTSITADDLPDHVAGSPEKRRKGVSRLDTSFNNSSSHDQRASFQHGHRARDGEDEFKSELHRLRRRILKDRVQTSRIFAKIETKRQEANEKNLREQAVSKEQNVNLYRNYREGDYPDIQIPYSSLIKPLQAVAQNDSVIAGYLFESIMNGLYQESAKNVGQSVVFQELTENLSNCIKHVFLSTNYYPRQLLSALINFCFQNSNTITFDLPTLTSACLNGALEYGGVILLEKYLYDHATPHERAKKSIGEPPSTKKSRPIKLIDQNVLMDYWIQLVRLYKSVDASEIVRIIFTDQLHAKDITRRALDSEFQGDYLDAVDLYTKALLQYANSQSIENSIDEAETEYWEESRLRCLELLNNWETLADVSARSIDDSGEQIDLSKIWESSDLQDIYFPCFMKSKLKLNISSGKSDSQTDALLKFIGDSLINAERRQFLENNHGLTLAVVSFLGKEYEKSQNYCNIVIKKNLKEWSSLNRFDIISRLHLLQDSQLLAELNHFLKLRCNKDVTSDQMQRVTEYWIKHTPSYANDDSRTWDDVITLRSVYSEEMCGKLIEAGLDKNEICRNSFAGEIEMRLQFVRGAVMQRNNHVALDQLKFVKRLLHLIRDKDGDQLALGYCEQYADAHFLLIEKSGFALSGVSHMLNVLDLLDRFSLLVSKFGYGSTHKLIEARTVEKMAWIFYAEKIDNLSKINDPTLKSNVKKIFSFASKQRVYETLFSKTFELYGKISENCEPVIDYCDKILRVVETDSESLVLSKSEVDNYATCLVSSLLRNMQNGYEDARRLFPRLLQVIELYPVVIDIFINLIENVPCWMFLAWIDQIVAVCDTDFGVHLHKIIESIAENYPQAIIYPLMIKIEHAEGISFLQGSSVQFTKNVFESIKNFEFIKRFTANLSLFSNIEIILMDCEKFIRTAMYKLSKIENSLDFVKNVTNRAYELIFPTGANEEHLGSYWIEFVQEYKPIFAQNYGDRFEGVSSLKDLETLKDAMKTVAGIVKKKFENLEFNNLKLKDYSAWLSAYSSEKFGDILEIPGQYTGYSKPIPEYHVFVSGFDSKVKTFSSLRKPRAVTIRGNDGRDYPFLIKLGEDLRQDQRVEQIFTQMNGVLTKDQMCKKHGASIRTYAVIPMTMNVGMIELIPNVQSLKDFMASNLPKDELDHFFDRTIDRLINVGYFMGIKKENLRDSNALKCLAYYKSYSRFDNEKAIRCFKAIRESAYPNLLRRSLLKLCYTPDVFYVLRRQFAVSYSTICVAHYLLGIGDRHLGNLMIDLSSASVVGIDFGYVFGTSTLIIGIPELTPFRMTKQITDVVEPVGLRGFFEPVMSYCMRAFRENAHLLLNTMDVFVKEPTLNWLQEAMSQIKNENPDDPKFVTNQEDNFDWYPAQKMNTVRRKFKGDHPALIIEEELRLGQTNKKVYKFVFPIDDVVSFLYHNGEGRDEIMAKNDPLSPENQVSALIHMATDPLILSRTYYGWEPWM